MAELHCGIRPMDPLGRGDLDGPRYLAHTILCIQFNITVAVRPDILIVLVLPTTKSVFKH